MNNFDISQYLVEPEFAAWLKENGFDGECDYFSHSVIANEDVYRSSNNVCHNKYMGLREFCIPTFQQAFDFCEEMFKVCVKGLYHSEPPGKVYCTVWAFDVGEYGEDYYLMQGWHDGTKREVCVAACNAIKEYISKQNVKTP